MLKKLRLLWQCRSKDKYVFFDCNEASLALAKDIIKHKKGIVLFVSDYWLIDDDELQKIKDIGAQYFIQRSDDTELLISNKLLKKALLKKKTHFFFLSHFDDENIEEISLFYNSWFDYDFELDNHDFELTIRIQNESMYPIVEDYMKHTPFEIPYTCFNDAELIASEVVKRFPPIDTLKVNTQNATVEDTYEVLIIGFDPIAEAILRKTIEATQFVGAHFKAIVMVNNTDSSIEKLPEYYHEMKNHYDIDFVNYNKDSDDMCEWMNEHADSIKQIIVTTKYEEERALAVSDTSLCLSNRNIYDVPVIIVVRDDEITLLEETKFSLIHYVGEHKNIFTVNKVLKSDYLQQAKTIHQFYNQLKSFAQRIPWEQLSNIKKESNIAASESLYAKLKLLGKTFDEIKQMSEIEFQLFLQEDRERLFNLAMAEHLRWNATYFTRGWKTWRLPEIPEGAPHQDEAQKLHACLVDWDSLKDVEKRFDIPFQKHDYGNILTIRMLITISMLDL